jgi:GAF domain-containing protein
MNQHSVPGTIDSFLSAPGGDRARVAELSERFRRIVEQNPSPERLCGELARLLCVQADGVALLRLQKNTLMFLVPARLRTAGTIPLSSPAVAARTASTKTTMLSNTFVTVRHASVFEGIKLEEGDSVTPTPIQKLMSVPIFDEDKSVLGVVQVSRKGKDAIASGPDFSHEDLHQLEDAAALIAKLPWMQDAGMPLDKSVERR